MKSIELFAGAGGLALGCELAGFSPVIVVERDKWSCDTIRENKKRGYPLLKDWNLHEGDVRRFDWSAIHQTIDLISGGPPCQPFSMGGKHRAYDDSRDMFPAAVDIIRTVAPKAFLIENVKGLTRSTFENYYQYILLQLEFPEVGKRHDETWFKHFLRLQSEKSSGRLHGCALAYNVVPTVVNAANYGVPQKRDRVFVIGFRSDLGIEWSFPEATHSYEALFFDQWITGAYWERHKITRRSRPVPSEALKKQIVRMRGTQYPTLAAWRTVRDALNGLPDPRTAEAAKILDHRYQNGARVYPGHTGSPLDLPAKTLKAGDHGVPGGENMMVDNGNVRYFTVRESARLQTFPDGYRFHGSWTEAMRQLGNAVPVVLAQIVASSIAQKIIASDLQKLSRNHRSVARIA
ncbi:MAG: DNA cytosine methyltransferase [Nitrospira sp.]|nr:DNA cytosine methyltransferase [Nitrospira sp.]